MSPQSIFTFVLLSALALSSPVRAGVIKSDLGAQVGLTAALCSGLHYSAPGVSPLYDACVAANLLVTANVLTTRSPVQAGLTASLCAGLNLNLIGNIQLHDACVAAGLLVAVDVTPKHNALTLKTSAGLYANAFLDAMNGCNLLSLQLKTVLVGASHLTKSTSGSLTVDVIIPIFVKLSARLNAAVSATASLTTCTDATVKATVLKSYTVFATSLEGLLLSLSTSLTQYPSVEIKAALHTALIGLRATLVVYHNRLDSYIASELTQRSIRAKLLLSLDAALKVTA